MTALAAVAQLGEIFDLKIAVGTAAGGDLFVIDPQGIAHVMEQAGDGIGRDGNAEFGQLFRDGGGSKARPTEAGPCLARRDVFVHAMWDNGYFVRFFSV